MNYTLCATCGHHRDVRESATGRLFWFCANSKCPDYGSQEWCPEPPHEEVARYFLFGIGFILAVIIAIITYDRLLEPLRTKEARSERIKLVRSIQAEANADRRR